MFLRGGESPSQADGVWPGKPHRGPPRVCWAGAGQTKPTPNLHAVPGRAAGSRTSPCTPLSMDHALQGGKWAPLRWPQVALSPRGLPAGPGTACHSGCMWPGAAGSAKPLRREGGAGQNQPGAGCWGGRIGARGLGFLLRQCQVRPRGPPVRGLRPRKSPRGGAAQLSRGARGLPPGQAAGGPGSLPPSPDPSRFPPSVGSWGGRLRSSPCRFGEPSTAHTLSYVPSASSETPHGTPPAATQGQCWGVSGTRLGRPPLPRGPCCPPPHTSPAASASVSLRGCQSDGPMCSNGRRPLKSLPGGTGSARRAGDRQSPRGTASPQHCHLN